MSETQYVEMSQSQQAFFQDVVDEMKRLTIKHRTITNMECAAILARCAGLCIAHVPDKDRQKIRDLSVKNIDWAISNYGVPTSVN